MSAHGPQIVQGIREYPFKAGNFGYKKHFVWEKHERLAFAQREIAFNPAISARFNQLLYLYRRSFSW